MKRLGFFVLLLSVLVAFGNEGWVRLYKLRRAEASLEEQNRRLVSKNEVILREIENLKDPKYLERLIRNDLGFTREGETLYELVSPPLIP